MGGPVFTEDDVAEQVALLRAPDNRVAYRALKALVEESGRSGAVYGHLDEFIAMMGDTSSYVRTRGLALIAANARWDVAGRVDAIVDRYLDHIEDDKPITARKCVGCLVALPRRSPPWCRGSCPPPETPTCRSIRTACGPWSRATSVTPCLHWRGWDRGPRNSPRLPGPVGIEALRARPASLGSRAERVGGAAGPHRRRVRQALGS